MADRPAPHASAPLGVALALLLPLALLAFGLLLQRPPAASGPALAWLAAVVAPAAALAWVAAAGQRGGAALVLLAAALVALSDATVPGWRGDGIGLQSLLKLALWSMGLLLACWQWPRLRQAATHPPSGFMLVFVVWAAAGALYGATPVYTAGASVALLGLWVAGSVCAQQLDVRQGLLALAIGLLPMLALSLLLLYLAPELALAPMEGGRLLRLAGTLGSPNQLGRAAALCLLVALLLAPRLSRHTAVVLLLATAALAGPCLLLSGSRGAVASLAAGVAVLLALTRPRLALLLALGSLVAVAWLAVRPDRVEGLFDLVSRTGHIGEVTSLTGRTAIWAAVADLIAQAPWLGHGFGATRDVLPAAFQGAHGWSTTSAHNLWLQVWVGTGLVGLLLVLATQAAWLRRAWHRPQPVREALLVFVAVNGLLEASAYGPSVNLLTFVACWALALGLRSGDD